MRNVVIRQVIHHFNTGRKVYVRQHVERPYGVGGTIEIKKEATAEDLRVALNEMR